VHSYTEQYGLDTIIIRPAGVFGRGHYIGGSTVGMIMRDLALAAIKGDSFNIDAKVYAPNEVVYAKDVALAIHLACKAVNTKQRTYNAGSGVVTGPEDLARIVKELAPNIAVKVTGSSSGESGKSAPLDLSASKAELGYAPKYPLKEALRDYMDELWNEGARG
jgi:UDP-glucose 4-epimerase